MSLYIRNDHGYPVGPLQVMDSQTSTGDGTRLRFDRPVERLALQVATGSTSARVVLYGSLASSSESAGLTSLIDWDASSAAADGETRWAASSEGPVCEVVVVLEAGASSDGTSAWVAAV